MLIKCRKLIYLHIFLEDLIDLNGKGMMGYCPDIYSGIRYYSDSLFEQ
jgi:hypothetical protein